MHTLRETGMNYRPNVLLIYPQAECRRCDHQVNFIIAPTSEESAAITLTHFAMKTADPEKLLILTQ
jgi:hypothetical protein